MTQLSLSIPVDGQPFATEGPKVGTSLTSIQSVVNGGLDTANLSPTAGITGAQLSGSLALADTQLASPNNATYKQIIPSLVLTNSNFSGGTASYFASGSTYLLSERNSAGVGAEQASSASAGMAVFYLDPADYTAGAKANKYRLRCSLLTNATAPTSTFTFGLYPVTACAGGGVTNSITLGAVTAGSTCAFVAPAANTLVTPVSSGDFSAPVAGYYALACAVTVATMVIGSSIVSRAILQHRQV